MSPVMIQDLTHATFSNITELGLQFVRFSLQRWLSMWEWGISRSLLGPIARQRFHAEFAVEGLLRAQPKERSEFYKTMIEAGVMLPAECRKLENLPQLDVDAITGE
jgi:HK97 family phage portal protein